MSPSKFFTALKVVTTCESNKSNVARELRHLEQPLTKDEDIGFKLYEDKLHIIDNIIINYLFYDVYGCCGNWRPNQDLFTATSVSLLHFT